MFDSNGPESVGPDEGGEGGTGNVSEGVSEQAREQFAQAQAAQQQIRKEEKKAKKRDTGVAQMILQFLTDTQRTHLATLISRLVASDCPSHFLLAILSLVNEGCRSAVDDYLQEQQRVIDIEGSHSQALMRQDGLDEEANALIIQWIMRMELVLSLDSKNILNAILVDDTNIDGTVLQLATFVFQQFLEEKGKAAPFETVQQLAIGVLQSIFAPSMHAHMQAQLEASAAEEGGDIDE
jgi:hypothetical protein